MDFDPIALASAVVAGCALGVTFWQAHLMRQHNKLSVRPMLATMERNDTKDNAGYVEFELKNCGVGPAIIKNFVLLNGDEEVSRNNRKTYDDFLREKAQGFAKVYTGSLVPGSALSVGEKHPLLAFVYDAEKQDVSFIHRLNLVVEYQSIYQDEVFVYDSRQDRQFHGLETAA